MAFTVRDYNDLKQLLIQHPEWRVELRQLLLTEDFEALPAIVRDLAEAQRRAEERLTRLEETVAALAEAQRRAEERLLGVEERLTRLEETVATLAEAQRRTEQRIGELAEAQRHSEERLARLEEVVAVLVEGQQRLWDKVSRIDGRVLEWDYREKAAGYFGLHLRKVRVVARDSLADMLEAHLSTDELNDVLMVDLVVRGQPRQRADWEEVWLAVEVSSVVDRQDVARARRRAELLRKAGYRAIPVVAGEECTQGAETEARDQAVVMLQDGRSRLWDEALAATDEGQVHRSEGNL